MLNSTPYVAGPALIWVGIPTNVVSIIPQLTGETTLRPQLIPPGGAELRPQLNLPGAVNGPVPATPGRGGRFSSTPTDPKDRSLVLRLFRTITPVFLGTCEDTPDLPFYPAYVPYYRESAGRTHPAERIWDGEEAEVHADLTRYNEYVYALIASHAANGGLAVPGWPRGTDEDGGIGTLVGTEGMGLPLWVVLPYAAKFGGAGMPGAYRYYCASLSYHHAGPLNTKGRKLRLSWLCQRIESPLTGAYLLYDHSTAGLPRNEGV